MPGFLDEIEPLKQTALAELKAAPDLAALEQTKGAWLGANGRFTAADDRLRLETYFDRPVTDEVQRSFDAMKVAAALREATWALVSEIHLHVAGVDYRAHADDFLARTELALAQFEDRHGRLRGD